MTASNIRQCPKCRNNTLHRNGKTPGGKTRWVCREGAGSRTFCYTTTNPNAEAAIKQSGAPVEKTVIKRRKLSGVQRFIVTAGQNATPVFENGLKSLETAANHLNAEIAVIPLRYKNPTSHWSASAANAEYWDERLTPYLVNWRKKLNPNLVLLGDIKTIPTASSPLTGFDAITHSESGILGHTKLQLKSIPTGGSFPKLLTTTGAITVPNYTDSKAGKLGEFHHTFGAVLVEIHGKTFHLRQLGICKDGSFIDLDQEYTPDGVRVAPPAEALVMGDTHVRVIDPAVERATFGPGGLADVLRTKRLVYHDLLDAESVNPHHRGNPFLAVSKRHRGADIARAEVEEAIRFLDDRSSGRESIIVSSNHDDMLQRWLSSNDWRTDPSNAEFYLETSLAMVRQSLAGAEAEKLNAFSYWVGRLLPNRPDVRCLKPDEQCLVMGIALHLHGHEGPNGARGSLQNLRRIGRKVFIAHAHTEGIDEGGWQVGTSSFRRLGYTSGPSSWTNSHGVIYANSKRCLVRFINGEFRL